MQPEIEINPEDNPAKKVKALSPAEEEKLYEEIDKAGRAFSFSALYSDLTREGLSEIKKKKDIYTYNALDKFITSQSVNSQYIFSYPIYVEMDYHHTLPGGAGVSVSNLNKQYFTFIRLAFSVLTLEMQQSLMSKILISLNSFLSSSSSEALEFIDTHDYNYNKRKTAKHNRESALSALDSLNAMSLEPQYKELFKNIGESINPENLAYIKSYNLKYLPTPYNKAFIEAVKASGTNNLSLLKNVNEIMKKNSQSAQYLVQNFSGWTESTNLAVFFENAISKKSVDEFLVNALDNKKIEAEKLSNTDFILKFIKQPNVSQEFKIYFLSQTFSSLNHRSLTSPLLNWMQEQISSNHELQGLFEQPPFNFKELMENQIKVYSLKDLKKIEVKNPSYATSIKVYLSKPETREKFKEEYILSISTRSLNNINHTFSNYLEYEAVLGKDFLNQEEKNSILAVLFKDSLSDTKEVQQFFTLFTSKIEEDSEFNALFASLLSASMANLNSFPVIRSLFTFIFSCQDRLDEENSNKINALYKAPQFFNVFIESIHLSASQYLDKEIRHFIAANFIKNQVLSATPFKYINSIFQVDNSNLSYTWNLGSGSVVEETLEMFLNIYKKEKNNLNYIIDLKKDNPLKKIIDFCEQIKEMKSLHAETKIKYISCALTTAKLIANDFLKEELNHLPYNEGKGGNQITARRYNAVSIEALGSTPSSYLQLAAKENFITKLSNKRQFLSFKERLFSSDVELEYALAQSLDEAYALVSPTKVVLSKDKPSLDTKALSSTNIANGFTERNNSDFYISSQAACDEVRKTLQASTAKGNLLNLEFKIKVDGLIINYLSFVKLIQHTPTSFLDENMYFLKTSLTQFLNEACIFYDNSVSKYNIMVEAKTSHFKKLIASSNIENLDEYKDNIDKKAISLISSLENQLEIVKGNVLNDLASSGMKDLDILNTELKNRYSTSSIQSVPLKEKIEAIQEPVATSKGVHVLKMNGK